MQIKEGVNKMSKYRRLREDDEDRVILPTFGEKESDLNLLQMARNVEKRKQAKAEERRKEREREVYREKSKNIFDAVDAEIDTYKKMEILFDALVPASGKADTVAGELVRAMMKIMYRDWNDGDIFYAGYGKETCGDAAEFLYSNAGEKVENDLVAIVEDELLEEDYTTALNNTAEDLIEFLESNPKLLYEPNDQDYIGYKSSGSFTLFDFVNDSHEFECDFGNNAYNVVNEYIDNESVLEDARDWIEDSLDYFVQQYSDHGRVSQPWRDGYVLTGLDILDLQEIEANWEDFARDLDKDLEDNFDLYSDEEEDW